MPILNGYEACHKIKEFYKQTSIRLKSNDLSDGTAKQTHTNKVHKQIEITRLRKMIDDYSVVYLQKQKRSNNTSSIKKYEKDKGHAQGMIYNTY